MVHRRSKSPPLQQQQQRKHRWNLHALLLLLQFVVVAQLLLTNIVGCTALRSPYPAFCVSCCHSSLSPVCGVSLRHPPASAASPPSRRFRRPAACGLAYLQGLQVRPGVRTQARAFPHVSAATGAASDAAGGTVVRAEGRISPSGPGGPACGEDGVAREAAPLSPGSGAEQQQQPGGNKTDPPLPRATRNRGVRDPQPVQTKGAPPNDPVPPQPKGALPRGPRPVHSRGPHPRESTPGHPLRTPAPLPLAGPSGNVARGGRKPQHQRSNVSRAAQQQQTRLENLQQTQQSAAVRSGPGTVQQQRDPQQRQQQQHQRGLPLHQRPPQQQHQQQPQQQWLQQQRRQQPQMPLQLKPHPYQQQRQKQQPQQQQQHQQQEDSVASGGLPGEVTDLVCWLRETKHPLEGRIVAKSSTSVAVQLLLPAAAQHLLPARTSIARQMFIGGDMWDQKGLGDSQTTGGDPEAHWNSLQPGDSIRVVVLGVQQQPQQHQQLLQRQQHQGFGSASKRVDANHFELVVQPILNEATTSSDLLKKEELHMTEDEILDRLLHQDVPSWVHFLSPPSATWVVPAFPQGLGGPLGAPLKAPMGGSLSAGLIPRRPHGSGSELKAPPSLRALRCRVVGVVPSKEAAVLEILAADDEWHEAVGSLKGAGAVAGAHKISPEASHTPADTSRQSESSRETSAAGDSSCGTPRPPSDTTSRREVFVYQQAERALRLEQQTSRDKILQEELLAQQEMLLRKMNPQAHAQQLMALERLLLQHPHLHTYHEQLYSYLHAPQRDAIGGWVLLPVKELLTYKRTRKNWGIRDQLRVYFSVFEECEDRRRRAPGRSVGAAGGGDEGLEFSSKFSLVWTSIFPAIPLEVAHLLLHDMPAGPLAPHLKMFEQRQLVHQQEEHYQLMQHTLRHNEELARERALRDRQKQQQQQQGETKTGAEGAAEDNQLKQQQSHANPLAPLDRSRSSSSISMNIGGSKDSRRVPKLGSLPPQRRLQALQQMLQRIPVKPLWWGRGDWVYREVRLCQMLGPFFYRQLLRIRAVEYRKSSVEYERREIFDIRGEPYEDLTNWLSTPEGRQRLKVPFVRRYVNALRWMLQLLRPEAFCKAFKYFASKNVAESDEALTKRIEESDLPEQAKGLLYSFLPLRRRILSTIAKRTSTPEVQFQIEHGGRKPTEQELAEAAASHAPSVVSPLMQLLRLHSYLRFQLRPQQRAPSLEEWQRYQQQRTAQRKAAHKPNSSLPSATDEDPMDQAAPEVQLQMGGEDEYEGVNRLTDEVEQQMIDFSEDDAVSAEAAGAPESSSGGGLTPQLNSAYPSGAIRKPRSFYNYFGDDCISLLETDPDEVLSRFAGGSSSSSDHEVFVPLQIDSESAAPSATSFLNFKP